MKRMIAYTILAILMLFFCFLFGCSPQTDPPEEPAPAFDYPDWSTEAENMLSQLQDAASLAYTLEAEAYWFYVAPQQEPPNQIVASNIDLVQSSSKEVIASSGELDAAVRQMLESAEIMDWVCGDYFPPGVPTAELILYSEDGEKYITLGIGNQNLSWRRKVFDACFTVKFSVDPESNRMVLSSLGCRGY